MLLICPVAYRPEHIGVSPSGKASAFGADIRWFESSHPSHVLQSRHFGDFFFYFQSVNQVRKLKSHNGIFQSTFELI